jgi:hypothetical protein
MFAGPWSQGLVNGLPGRMKGIQARVTMVSAFAVFSPLGTKSGKMAAGFLFQFFVNYR